MLIQTLTHNAISNIIPIRKCKRKQNNIDKILVAKFYYVEWN